LRFDYRRDYRFVMLLVEDFVVGPVNRSAPTAGSKCPSIGGLLQSTNHPDFPSNAVRRFF
jgi:hypothetical protein